MKKLITTQILFLFILKTFSQILYENLHSFDNTSPYPIKTTYQSWDGNGLLPSGQYRALSIFVNIIYDITGIQDPYPSAQNESWAPATIEGINNQSIPNYFHDFADVNYTSPNDVHGLWTRLYYESSFGNLKFLSDFMIVNIKHSTIISSHPSIYTFSKYDLRDAVINYINTHGGLNTYFAHNTLADYDQNSDGEIDIGSFFYRNSKSLYGDLRAGEGNSGVSHPNIIIGGISHPFDENTGMLQGIGNDDQLITKPINIFSHEVGHLFFGGNNFHTSGGNHYSTYWPSPFMGLQGGGD